MEPYLVSIAEASRLTGMGRSWLFARVADGSLESKKVGTRRLIVVASLKELVGLTEPDA